MRALFVILEKEEEVVYYDACEDPEQLRANEGMGLVHDSRSVDIKMLLHKVHQLENKRGAICSRRSYLRNKRVIAETSIALQGGNCFPLLHFDLKDLNATIFSCKLGNINMNAPTDQTL